jgi:hypothetical protein
MVMSGSTAEPGAGGGSGTVYLRRSGPLRLSPARGIAARLLSGLLSTHAGPTAALPGA